MAGNGVERRLAAVLSMDVVGYSHLMALDEAGTLGRLMDLRSGIIDPLIERYSGRLVKLMGDGALVEYASVVDAVSCAMAIQKAVTTNQAGADENERIEFRIGINLGDIIVEGDDIYGDGVNVAARIEGLASPGGICISRTARDQVRDKLDVVLVDLGEIEVKNFPRPIRVFRVPVEPAATTTTTTTTSSSVPSSAPTLPENPSIAVLPFDNMSGDLEQEYLADGIAEDLITALSKIRWFFVIARNSTFTYKGQAVDVTRVAEELGVRYVLEGSVRKSGNRVRTTAQLIDATTGAHIWAERYDRELEDIFAVQDEVTQSIVSTIEPQLASSERQRAHRKPTDSLDAWACYQRSLWHLYQYRAEDNLEALNFLQRAINLDPDFASAHAGLAFTLYYHVILGFSQAPDDDLARGLDAGMTALRLDENDPFAYVALGRIYTAKGEHEAAIQSCERALALNPSYAAAHFGRAHSLWMWGRSEEAIHSHDEAMRLSPLDPLLWAFQASKAIALIPLGRYEEALDWARKAQRQPTSAIWAFMPEVCALGLLDRIKEAQAALERLRRLKPDVTCGFAFQVLPFSRSVDLEHFKRGLLVAGVPE